MASRVGPVSGALGISGASPPASTPQPPRKPPPSSPSPRTPPHRCSSAGRYCPLCPPGGGCHGPAPWEVAPRGGRASQVPGALQGCGLGLCWHRPPCRSRGAAISGCPRSEQPLPALSPQPPAEDKINGILLGFRLRYRELLYDSLRGFTLRGIGNPGATWAELTRECLQPRGTWGHVAGGWHGGGGAGQGSVLHPALTPASCAPPPLPGASLEPWRPSGAPRSCHRPLCVTDPFVSPSLSVPNALVCAGAGSVLLCSAPSVPAARVSTCAHLTLGGPCDVPAVSARAAILRP